MTYNEMEELIFNGKCYCFYLVNEFITANSSIAIYLFSQNTNFSIYLVSRVIFTKALCESFQKARFWSRNSPTKNSEVYFENNST